PDPLPPPLLLVVAPLPPPLLFVVAPLPPPLFVVVVPPDPLFVDADPDPLSATCPEPDPEEPEPLADPVSSLLPRSTNAVTPPPRIASTAKIAMIRPMLLFFLTGTLDDADGS